MHTWDGALDGQRDGQDDHQCLVSHGIDDAPRDGLELPFPRQPAVDQIRDACIRKEAQRPCVVVVQQQIGGGRRGEQAGDGQEVGQVVDVLVWRQTSQRGADLVSYRLRAFARGF